ncbi:MAG: type II secretion system F family protein [Candidatus Omnitrophica bacterium]|nr:type II secretion system F family protein [Candidatus Omnitrophota bacterium]
MIYLSYILILSSALFVGLALSSHSKVKPKIELIPSEENVNPLLIKRKSFFKLFDFLLPLNKVIVDRLGRRRLEDLLLASKTPLLAEDFFFIKELILGLCLFVLFFTKGGFLGIFLLGMSLIVPDFYLKLRLKKRQRYIIRELPDVIDLLSLCVNAGLDFGVAVKWVVDKSKPSPLIEELGLFLLETKVGKPRRQALQDMARRLNLPEISSFCRTLIQAERLGTPVESALNILSEETRDYRFRRGERLALQAPIKMLFPLIFFIMPVVGIIVGGPVLLQFLKGGIPGFKGF